MIYRHTERGSTFSTYRRFYFLHVANADTFFERSDFVRLFRHELLSDKTFIPDLQQHPHNGRIVKFLRFVDFGTSRITSRMEMGDIFVILADVVDDIAFHDLHVINIVKQLEIGRPDTPAQFRAPNRMVAQIIFVAYAVKQLHRHGHAGVEIGRESCRERV